MSPRLIALGPLRRRDLVTLHGWAARFLREHARAWVDARGLGWSDAEVEGQLLGVDRAGDYLRGLVRSQQAPEGFVRVARRGDRPVGVVWAGVGRDDQLQVREGVLHWIHVAPASRRQGLATRLLDETRDWMVAQGATSVSLRVLADNPAAQALYRRAGLTVADVRMMGPLRP